MDNAMCKYSSRTLIGNWREEKALEECKDARFEKRTNDGTGHWKKLQAKMQLCNESVPLSFSDDGLIRFGDSIVLQHDQSSNVLACDPFEEVLTGSKKYCVSGVEYEHASPKARSTFTVLRPPPRLRVATEDPNDEVLRLGTSFQLRCNESLLVMSGSSIMAPYLYLSSTIMNERNATSITNKQMVYMSPECGADSIWTACIPSQGRRNGSERLLKLGYPMNLTDSYQLTHRQTNKYVTLSNTYSRTEFGVESQCYADRSTACGKLGLMVSEMKGQSTPATLTKPDAPVFSWHIVMATESSFAEDTRTLPLPPTVDVLIAQLREDVSFSAGGLGGLQEYFEGLERKQLQLGKMDRQDFKSGLEDYLEGCLSLADVHLETVIDLVDAMRIQKVDYMDLCRLLQ